MTPEYNVVRHATITCMGGPIFVVAVGDYEGEAEVWRAYIGVAPASFDTELGCQWVAKHGGKLRPDEALAFFSRFGPEFNRLAYR